MSQKVLNLERIILNTSIPPKLENAWKNFNFIRPIIFKSDSVVDLESIEEDLLYVQYFPSKEAFYAELPKYQEIINTLPEDLSLDKVFSNYGFDLKFFRKIDFSDIIFRITPANNYH